MTRTSCGYRSGTRALTPRGYPWGTKRLCVDTNFYETFNNDHVHLVDLRAEPLEEIVSAGIRTAARTYELDAIVFATRFDAMAGALLAIDIRGRDGRAAVSLTDPGLKVVRVLVVERRGAGD